MVAVVFAVETVGGCCCVRSCSPVWVHHVSSAHRDRLLQSSSASLAFLALRVMPYAAVPLHPSARQALSGNTWHCFPPVPSRDDNTRTRCSDTCRQLKFPSILVLCQEEATREPCLQPLRLMPVQLLMLMSLLQLHAAIFSILIATPDSTERMQEVVSFSELSVFLVLLSVNVLQGILWISDCLLSSLGHVMSLSVPVSSLFLPRSEVHTS